MQIDKFLVKADAFLDYVPLASTFSNALVIAQKIISNLRKSNSEEKITKRYFTHINDKSYKDCAILLIPFVNTAFCLYRSHQKRSVLKKINQEEIDLKIAKNFTSLPERIKQDKDVALAAVQKNGLLLKEIKPTHKGYKKIASAAIKNDIRAVSHVSATTLGTLGSLIKEESTKQKDILREQVLKGSISLKDVVITEGIHDDKEVALAAVTRDGLELERVSLSCEDYIKVAKAAIRQNPDALQFIRPFDFANILKDLSDSGQSNEKLKANFEQLKKNYRPLVEQAIDQDPKAINWVDAGWYDREADKSSKKDDSGKVWKNFNEIAEATIKKHPFAIKFIKRSDPHFEKLVKIALDQDPNAFEHVPADYRLYLECLAQPVTLQSLDKKYFDDEENLLLIIRMIADNSRLAIYINDEQLRATLLEQAEKLRKFEAPD